MHAHSVTDDQYEDYGIVSEEEAYWPTHHINVLCGQRAAADVQRTAILRFEPDSLVTKTEGSKICQ